ncbi:uncharacterized protein LOC127122044 [Lathyrus oleraceus]|uniref:uncharacterized protein LOC127122044 n=1 Tax=Pisum sativum TaxID=3888 RepID=UPI0021D167ED|nr:uncharacterized protein LOC127122044 [Pisum sativum]
MLLLDVIKQVPKYAKFLKDLCTNKRHVKGGERVNLGRNISTFIQPRPHSEKVTGEQNVSAISQVLPQKCKDPGTFTIPCTIGDKQFDNCMLDLGVGINVMPTSIYNNHCLGHLQHTGLIVQLANRSNACPAGIVEDVLVQVLKKHNKLIGWTLADILGISPSMCMHRVLLEDGAKMVRQPQRRLNPLILDVVKKEVTKLLQADIICPISDSKWVSLVVVVPKKSGLTVVKNEKNELVPTRVHNSWRVCYFQIHIAPEDQEKTTFTCPFGTFTYGRMPFGLYNAPSTFQQCMISIFSEFIENYMEVFMDDFTVYDSSFDACLKSLNMVLERCIETDLVLNYEKCHFMVEKGIVLAHIISEKGIFVDPAKIDVISTLAYPSCIREIRSFLGHAGIYRHFIKDFSKIALPLSNLLKNDVTFSFDDKCKQAFDFLKKALTSAPIIQPPDWTLPFKIMCDASNYIVGVVLAQRVDKNPEAKPRLIRWILFLQEFNVEIKDKSGAENLVDDHLSASRPQIHKLKSDAKYYVWDDPYLWKFGSDQVIRRCVPDYEIASILNFSHASQVGGHFGPQGTARKVLDSVFYWPTIFKDAYEVYRTCKECQIAGTNVTHKSEMPQQPMLFCEWVDAIPTRTNDSRVVADFAKSNIFCRFGIPRAIISDQGTYFCNRTMEASLRKYGVMHRISTTYHPQTNGQAMISNREIK